MYYAVSNVLVDHQLKELCVFVTLQTYGAINMQHVTTLCTIVRLGLIIVLNFEI